MDGEAANKRGRKVVSRRVPQATAEEVRSMLGGTPQTLPRSGHHHIHTKDEDSSKHPKYRVNVPVRMLLILGLVFVVGPLSVFWYKEKHIHDESQHAAHYKTEKLANVDTHDLFSQFSNHAGRIHANNSTNAPQKMSTHSSQKATPEDAGGMATTTDELPPRSSDSEHESALPKKNVTQKLEDDHSPSKDINTDPSSGDQEARWTRQRRRRS